MPTSTFFETVFRRSNKMEIISSNRAMCSARHNQGIYKQFIRTFRTSSWLPPCEPWPRVHNSCKIRPKWHWTWRYSFNRWRCLEWCLSILDPPCPKNPAFAVDQSQNRPWGIHCVEVCILSLFVFQSNLQSVSVAKLLSIILCVKNLDALLQPCCSFLCRENERASSLLCRNTLLWQNF